MAILSYLLALLVFAVLAFTPMSKHGNWRPPLRSPSPSHDSRGRFDDILPPPYKPP